MTVRNLKSSLFFMKQGTVSGPQNAGGPQNVGFYEMLKISPGMSYLGENPYITASLDMIYGI